MAIAANSMIKEKVKNISSTHYWKLNGLKQADNVLLKVSTSHIHRKRNITGTFMV